jgi:IS1 family transposase
MSKMITAALESLADAIHCTLCRDGWLAEAEVGAHALGIRAYSASSISKKHEAASVGGLRFLGMAGTQKAIISWGVGKRTMESTMDFLHDLRGRVIGQPEISTDGFHPYRVAIRDAFGQNASHGVIVKTYSVTNLAKDAATRYSPAAVVKVEREVVTGDPDQYVSTSYVERQNLSLRMSQRRFTRLTNGFSKKLDNHVAAVALYVAH